ncbi:porin family protein [Formosa sp. PL04]|uniref:porin family protein n=1 Tax=Formosa sp. PL04 TaxID=3081755 RepID=UPI002980F7B7|nr:porin family protein [Formosa sp. PL04]MDW5289645.1 porin family protein [Formosa sp. PL04]
MKHFYKLFAVAFIFISSGVFAQETKVGVRLGVGLPNLQNKDNNVYSKDYSTVAGFDGGIFMDFGLTENFSIKTELYYASKGGERNGMQPIPPTQLPPEFGALVGDNPIFADFDNRAVFNYIGIPVLAKYEWNLGKNWGVYANAGLYVEFIVDPKQETSGTSQMFFDEAGTMPIQVPHNVGTDTDPVYILVDLPPMDLTATTDVNSEVANMDFGAMLGGGVSYQVGEAGEIIFDVRGSYGFIPLQNDTDTYGTVHMGSLTFSLGYAYAFKTKKKQNIIPVN